MREATDVNTGARHIGRAGLAAAAAVAMLPIVTGLTACGGKSSESAPPLTTVSVVVVTPQVTPLTVDLLAQIKASHEVELRPQVSGILTAQHFASGELVRRGALLYTVDPRPFDESVATARANLAEAEASLGRAQGDVERYQPLLADNAIARQTYEQAVAEQSQRKAAVAARRAALAMAELQRAHADIRSPISGRIGQSDVDVGELATAGQTRLATVSTLDPALAEFSISERDYLAMVTGNAEARAEAARAANRPIQLLLADGSIYGHPAHFTFVDRAVSKTTGSLALQAEVPNPDGVLRPGMNARVRITYSVAPNALLVPQRAVTEMLGKHFVLKVGAEDRIEQQAVEPGPRVGDMWVMAAGLSQGDRVVTDGIQIVKPGQKVAVKPASPVPATAATAQ